MMMYDDYGYLVPRKCEGTQARSVAQTATTKTQMMLVIMLIFRKESEKLRGII